MRRSPHTQGPLEVVLLSTGGYAVQPTDRDETVAYVPEEGDALLFAAAPRMKECLAYVDYAINGGGFADDEIVEVLMTGKAIKDVRAVLAAVEGRRGRRVRP